MKKSNQSRMKSIMGLAKTQRAGLRTFTTVGSSLRGVGSSKQRQSATTSFTASENDEMRIIPLGNIGGGVHIKSEKVHANVHEVFLDTEIGDPSEYRDLLSLLFNADSGDHFAFYINTIGGDLSSTMAIIEGLKHTAAECSAILLGDTHSGGSLISMYCSELVVTDSASMMIHHAAGGVLGHMGNIREQANFSARRVERILEEAYEGFLTQEEIADVKKGVEIWLDAPQIRERLKTRSALLEAEAAAQEDREQGEGE